jgi:hypothetical protein
MPSKGWSLGNGSGSVTSRAAPYTTMIVTDLVTETKRKTVKENVANRLPVLV